MNKSGITPVGDRVVVEIEETESVTKGGIIIPEFHKDKKDQAQQVATVLEVGEIAEMGLSVFPEPGDRVLITKYAGVRRNDENYAVIRGDDIVGIIK